MKITISSVLILLCGVSLADSSAEGVVPEVYFIETEHQSANKSSASSPLQEKAENIIRLDDEFPELFKQSVLQKKQKNLRSRLPMESPLTGSTNELPQAFGVAGSLTHMRPRTASDYNPLMCPVKWRWGNTMSVGKAVQIVADFIGYRLVIREPVVGQVYSMPLPYIHRKVKSIEAWAAFELLGGPGLMVVIDPASRTVMHRVRKKYVVSNKDKKNLPNCAGDLTFAESPVGTETGVLIVGDEKCTL